MTRLFRLLGLALVLGAHCVVAACVAWSSPAAQRRKRLARMNSRSANALAWVLGLRASQVYRAKPLSRGENALIVANHVSYVDAILIAAENPCVFVTSVEVRETPVLGLIAELSGSVFVERRHRDRRDLIDREVDVLADALREGVSVVLFPEGTSSDGSDILPFKRTFFESAIRAGVPVMAYFARYDQASLPKVAYWGADRFGPHIGALASLPRIQAELVLVQRVATEGETRHDLSMRCQVLIRDEHRRRSERGGELVRRFDQSQAAASRVGFAK